MTVKDVEDMINLVYLQRAEDALLSVKIALDTARWKDATYQDVTEMLETVKGLKGYKWSILWGEKNPLEWASDEPQKSASILMRLKNWLALSDLEGGK